MQTISRAHQNAAKYHYQRAAEAWDTYQHCLDDKGLYHPDFLKIVKESLSDFWFHTGMGDYLMRKRPSQPAKLIGQPVIDNRAFARDFELAVMQRGKNAKEGKNA